MLEGLEAMAEISSLFRRGLRIYEHRQIAGDASRIHVVEEIGTVAAKQVLHVVLGGRQYQFDPGFIHQPVEARVIKRNRKATPRLSADIHGIARSLIAGSS